MQEWASRMIALNVEGTFNSLYMLYVHGMLHLCSQHVFKRNATEIQ